MNANTGRSDYCRKHGCALAKECGKVCDLQADEDEGDFDLHADDRHNDQRTGQAEGLNAWKRTL